MTAAALSAAGSVTSARAGGIEMARKRNAGMSRVRVVLCIGELREKTPPSGRPLNGFLAVYALHSVGMIPFAGDCVRGGDGFDLLDLLFTQRHVQRAHILFEIFDSLGA